mmetsp:Transcript_32774/g.53531  ORF Transcript_32774/g.53531 Transcript_32774/m.53531 type:complete len:217 (-) Transcript_32774:135-785(-)
MRRARSFGTRHRIALRRTNTDRPVPDHSTYCTCPPFAGHGCAAGGASRQTGPAVVASEAAPPLDPSGDTPDASACTPCRANGDGGAPREAPNWGPGGCDCGCDCGCGSDHDCWGCGCAAVAVGDADCGCGFGPVGGGGGHSHGGGGRGGCGCGCGCGPSRRRRGHTGSRDGGLGCEGGGRRCGDWRGCGYPLPPFPFAFACPRENRWYSGKRASEA